MKRLFFVRLAFLNTFKKRARATLAIGGIALTSAVMIVLFGVQNGLQQLIATEVNRADSQDVITVSQRNANQVRLNDVKISDIQSITGVSVVGQSVGLAGIAIYHGITLDTPVYGVSNNYLALSQISRVTGQTESQPTGSNIIVSTQVLQVFGIQQSEAVGRSVGLRVVIGSDYASGLSESEKKTESKNYTITGVVDRAKLPIIYMPLEDLRREGVDNVAQLKLRVNGVDKVKTVRETIEQMGLQTASVLDTIERVNKLFDVIRNILFIFCVIVLVVTVSSTFTIITLTLMEETRQIGFLRILGLRHDDVRTLFIAQSIILTFLGAIGGVMIGLIAGGVLNGLARNVATTESFTDTITLFAIPVQPIIIILMLSVVIGWVVGLVPAGRATRINPLQELEL